MVSARAKILIKVTLTSSLKLFKILTWGYLIHMPASFSLSPLLPKSSSIKPSGPRKCLSPLTPANTTVTFSPCWGPVF